MATISERTVAYFRKLDDVGYLDETDTDVGTAAIGIKACGGVHVRMQILVNDKGIITDAKFKTYGCASAIACSSYVVETAKNKTLEEAESITKAMIDKELSLMRHKKHCADVTERTLKAAIANYRSKNDNTN